MSLHRCLPFAILFAIAALAASGTVSVCKAKSDALKPDTLSRASALAAAPSQPAKQPDRGLDSSRRKGHLPPASFAPIQFKDPKNLGLGKLLVASRGLADPAFAETVVLLVHYDDTGVLGLILNRRTDLPLSRVLDLKAAKGRSDPVYLGGPLQPSAAFALTRSSARMEKAQNIFPGVYLISDKGLFEQALSARPDPGAFRVYMGYAGWTKEQLRDEVQSGAWFVLPADAATVFNSHPESLWPQMIQKTKLQWAKAKPPAGIIPPVSRLQ